MNGLATNTNLFAKGLFLPFRFDLIPHADLLQLNKLAAVVFLLDLAGRPTANVHGCLHSLLARFTTTTLGLCNGPDDPMITICTLAGVNIFNMRLPIDVIEFCVLASAMIYVMCSDAEILFENKPSYIRTSTQRSPSGSFR